MLMSLLSRSFLSRAPSWTSIALRDMPYIIGPGAFFLRAPDPLHCPWLSASPHTEMPFAEDLSSFLHGSSTRVSAIDAGLGGREELDPISAFISGKAFGFAMALACGLPQSLSLA
jgi:hypothetical protein